MLLKYYSRLKNKIKLNRLHRRFGENIDVAPSIGVDENTQLEGYNYIGGNTKIASSKVGLVSYIGHNCNLSHCEIGRFCSISWNVEVMAGEHPIDYVSTHPIFYSKRVFGGLSFQHETDFKELTYAKEPYFVKIGNDVLINAHVKIAGGVTIGDGAIIKSGCVVTRDIPPFAIVGGVPGKIIKYRFNEEEIAFLLNAQWWNKELGWLRHNVDEMCSIERFKNCIQTSSGS